MLHNIAHVHVSYCCLFVLFLQEVLIPYDPKSKHLRVDKNISLRVYCKDKAPGTYKIILHVYHYTCTYLCVYVYLSLCVYTLNCVYSGNYLS